MNTITKLAIVAFFAAAPLGAQAPVTLVPIPSRTYIGFNPLGLPADVGTLEIESAIAPGVTLGGVASYIDVSDHRFTTFEFKARYYPGEVVLRDYSIGATVGYTRFSNVVNGSREGMSVPTLGMVVDRNWIFGRSERFLLGGGVGAKRVLAAAADRERVNVDRAIFTVRFIVGWAF